MDLKEMNRDLERLKVTADGLNVGIDRLESEIKVIENAKKLRDYSCKCNDKPIEIPENFPVKINGPVKDKVYTVYYKHDLHSKLKVDVEPDWEMVWRLLGITERYGWAKYLTCNVDGSWLVHGNKPMLVESCGGWQGSPVTGLQFMSFPDWKNSLSKRPDNL